LDTSFAQAQQQARQLKASYEQASANVDGLTKQLAYNTQRLADILVCVSSYTAYL
jgi:hypothetical protein